MIAYHEVSPEHIDRILQEGLKRTSRGDKGDDENIIATDNYLDKMCPKILKDQGVSRDNNIYAYVVMGDKVLRITDGKLVNAAAFVAQSKQKVLELSIDPKHCFVSNLDMYDKAKNAIQYKQPTLQALAQEYWEQLRPIDEYTVDDFSRAELMITYDISSTDIRVLN